MFVCHGECKDARITDKTNNCICGVCTHRMEEKAGKPALVGPKRCKTRMYFEMLIEEKVQFT